MATPGLYGLSTRSSYEDFQTAIASDVETGCHLPCPCHTAEKGETCRYAVLWAKDTGIEHHSEWYGDLTSRSTEGEIQAYLHVHDNRSECELPCSASLARSMTFFCFSIIRHDGYEPDVVRNQFAWNAGIFACDEYAVLCDKRMVLGWSETGPITTIPFYPAPVGVSKDKTAANTLLFMRAWEAIRSSTNYRDHDWTLKVDPDAVLLPDRLFRHLAPYSSDAVYLTNCDKFQGPGWPMMFGSLEVFSRGAINRYFDGAEKCKHDLDWKAWGEDYFMGHCLDYLGVEKADDFGMIQDGVCMGVNCSDPFAVAFHPFKSTVSWMKCWKRATGRDDYLPKREPVLHGLEALMEKGEREENAREQDKEELQEVSDMLARDRKAAEGDLVFRKLTPRKPPPKGKAGAAGDTPTGQGAPLGH